METKKNRRRDRISAAVSILLIFGVCASLCLFFYLRGNKIEFSSYKNSIVKKYERQQLFRKQQADYKELCDSLYMRIEHFEPEVNASFEENDIKFLINDLKNVYEQNAYDTRYKVFFHIASCYEMWFADKKILWSKKSNIYTFRKNLELCEMGLLKKEEELKTKQKAIR